MGPERPPHEPQSPLRSCCQEGQCNLFLCAEMLSIKGQQRASVTSAFDIDKGIRVMLVLISAAQEGCWQIGGSSEKNHKNMI